MLLAFLLLLTLAISAWDSYVAGRAWYTSRGIAVCALIMGACGFIELWAALFGYVAFATGHLPPHAFQVLMESVYLLIIIPVLGSGLAITAYSWVVAARSKSLIDYGVAGYNTVAQVSNIISAAQNMGPFFGDVLSFFTSDSDSDETPGAAALVLAILGLAIVVAFGTVYALWRAGVKAEARTFSDLRGARG